MISSAILCLTLSLGAPEPTAAPARDPAADPTAAPSLAPPNPGAPPSEGVHAVGSSAIAPLPPAPPPVSPTAIPTGSWRGQGWISLRLHVAGPIAGAPPARRTVIGLGGSAEAGWRARQWLAIGAGFARLPHEVYRQDLPEIPATVTTRGYMSLWDVAFMRLYAPVRGRVDPFIDVGGGLSFYDPARERPALLGASVRASAGFEAWVSRQMTLGLSGLYRATFIERTIGHGWQVAIGVGIHW